MKIHKNNLAITKYTITWFPVVIFMIIAAYARFWINTSGNYLLIGGDGPYYPLQVRSMMEQGRLALPDMPLLFMIEALLAKILLVLNVSSQNGCVLLAVKLMDAILPPLAAIPVFLISKELYTQGIKARLLSYVVVGFSIINLTPTAIFSSGLQKNAFAVFWMFLYLFHIIRLIKTEQRRYFWHALFALILCAFTHFGSFSILLLFTGLIILFWIAYNKERLKIFNYRNVIATAITLAVLLLMIGYFDPARLNRLINLPFKVFEFPLYLLMAKGYDITEYLSPLHMILGNFLTIIAWSITIYNRKKLANTDKVFIYALIISAFFLSSPLLGLEWANRLHVMSYIPIVIIYLFIFNKIQSMWIKLLPALIFLLIIPISLLILTPNKGCITKEAFNEFIQIKEHINFTSNSVIIGRQDLRLLGSWEFRTKSAAEYLFKKTDFEKYDTVYVVRQIQGSNFSSGRPRGDAAVPANSTKVYTGKCFELYKVNSSDHWEGGTGKPSKAKGIITSVNDHLIVVKNDKTGRIKTIAITNSTKFKVVNDEAALKPGMHIEVFGSWKPFSLQIDAELICETKIN